MADDQHHLAGGVGDELVRPVLDGFRTRHRQTSCTVDSSGLVGFDGGQRAAEPFDAVLVSVAKRLHRLGHRNRAKALRAGVLDLDETPRFEDADRVVDARSRDVDDAAELPGRGRPHAGQPVGRWVW